MGKFLIVSFLVLLFAAPAIAKSPELYPVSCDDLWAAVKDTLSDSSNYFLMSASDSRQRATFVVVGDLVQYTEKVALTAKGGGCLANATMNELGPDNADWRQFHHRLKKTLAKLQAAKLQAEKPKPPTETASQP
jgi:hypothetical protein